MLVCLGGTLVGQFVFGFLQPRFIGERALPYGLFLSIAVPLVVYHAGLRTEVFGGTLTAGAVDSVYYFGFLITVVTLGFAAIAARSSADPIASVVLQFAMGLGATAYSVVARMHLAAAVEELTETDRSRTLDDYQRRAGEMFREMDEIWRQLRVFGDGLVAQAAAVSEASGVQTERTMSEVTRAVATRLNSLADETAMHVSSNLRHLKETVESVTLSAEQETLRGGLDGIAASVSELRGSLRSLSSSADEATDAIRHTRGEAATLGERLGDVHHVVDQLGVAILNVDDSISTLSVVGVTLGNVSSQLQEAASGFSEFSASAREAVPAFLGLKEAIGEAATHLASFGDASRDLGAVSEGIQSLAMASSALNGPLGQLSEAVPKLVERTRELVLSFSDMQNATGTAAVEFASIPQSLIAVRSATESFDGVVRDIGATLDSALSASRRVHEGAERGKQTIEAADLLLRSADDLRESIGELIASVGRFAAATTAAGATISGASETIRQGVKDAADELGQDARQSSEAVGVLVTGLSSVAQMIVDATNDRRGARP